MRFVRGQSAVIALRAGAIGWECASCGPSALMKRNSDRGARTKRNPSQNPSHETRIRPKTSAPSAKATKAARTKRNPSRKHRTKRKSDQSAPHETRIRPEREEVLISDAFIHGPGIIEVTATVLNVSEGHNRAIMEACDELRCDARR